MRIELEYKGGGYANLVVDAENVNIREDADEAIYARKEDGSKDFSKRLGRDITDDVMNQIGKLMEDLAYYRDANWDGTTLIETLFERLPQEKVKPVLDKLITTYKEEE